MDDIIWFIFIFYVIYLSIRFMIIERFDSVNIKKFFNNIEFKNITSLYMFLGTKIGVGVFISVSIFFNDWWSI